MAEERWSEPARGPEPWSEPAVGPEPWSEPAVGPVAAPPAYEFAFGKTAEYPHPEMHPELTKMDRFKIDFRGGNPEVGQRYLESKGFQVQPKEGFQYALKKGKGDWYLFDELGPSFQDVSDVAGDVLSIGGMIGGASLAVPAAVTGPGAFALGVAGAGAGAGVMQGVRAAAGEAMGVPSRAGEVAGEIGQEALAGAGAQVLGVGAGKLLGMGGKALGRGRAAMRGTRRAKARPAREVRQAQDDMVKAVEALEPNDQAVVEFIRRTKSKRSAQEAGDLRTMVMQATPGNEPNMRNLAVGGARSLASNPKFNHLTEKQLAELFYRRQVHGLSPKGLDEVLLLAKGMPANEVDDLIKSLSPAFPFNPRAKNLFGPVVDTEARAAQMQQLGKIPRRDAIDFWRFIPIEGIRKVTLPDGKVLQLTVDQAKAARHIIVDIGTHGIPFRAKVGKALSALGKALQVPRTLLFRGLKLLGLDFIKQFSRRMPRFGRQQMATAGGIGMAFGAPLGVAYGATSAGAAVGKALQRIGNTITADTSGGLLHGIAYSVGMGLSRKIQKVLKFLDRPALYRLGVYELLRDPEFMEAAEERIGAPGDGSVSGMGVAPGA